MKLQADNNKSRSELTFFVLTAVAVLSGALALAKGASFFRGPARVKQIVAQAEAGTDQEPNDLQPYLDQAREAADALKKSNLFVKEPPKEHPVKQVDGILGNEALIAGKWYKVGDTIGDAKILAIEPTEVRVCWDGQEKGFAPLAAAGADQRPGPSGQEMPKKPERPRQEATKVESGPHAAPAEVKIVTAPGEGDEFAWMGVDLPANVKEKLLDHWNKMSDEEKEKAKDEWNRMPPEGKQKAIEVMGRNM